VTSRARRRSGGAGAALAVLLLFSSACGSASAGRTQVTVLAASSLSQVFPEIGRAFERSQPGLAVQFEFAGTDALAVQLEQGSPGDVFAGASASFGDRLFAEGLIASPRPFATNRLVVVLPRANPAGIRSLGDLTRPIKLVIGAASVPVGAYTRKALSNLNAEFGSGYSAAVLSNVVSEEANVEGVLTKVRLGEADAGFVYVTDALSAGSEVRTIDLPASAQATAVYPIAVVRSSSDLDDARSFVSLVLSPTGQQLLRHAGFGPPPHP